MEFDLITLISAAAALVLGFLTGKLSSKQAATSPAESKISGEKSKLEKEVLQDKVKQLEAKIATLEKALEIQ